MSLLIYRFIRRISLNKLYTGHSTRYYICTYIRAAGKDFLKIALITGIQ